jgi:hypothetical protein
MANDMTDDQQAILDKQCKAMAEEIEQLRGFVAEFENWLGSNIIDEDAPNDAYWVISPSVHSTFSSAMEHWCELKAEHLGEGE